MKKVSNHAIIPSDSVQLHLEETIIKIGSLLEETYGPYGKNIIFFTKFLPS